MTALALHPFDGAMFADVLAAAAVVGGVQEVPDRSHVVRDAFVHAWSSWSARQAFAAPSTFAAAAMVWDGMRQAATDGCRRATWTPIAGGLSPSITAVGWSGNDVLHAYGSAAAPEDSLHGLGTAWLGAIAALSPGCRAAMSRNRRDRSSVVI